MKYKYKKYRKYEYEEWDCESDGTEYCENGCRSGACLSASRVCAKSALPSMTCTEVFPRDGEKIRECQDAVGPDGVVCPLRDATWGLGNTNAYRTWKNIFDSREKTMDCYEAAVNDAISFRHEFFGRMFVPLDAEKDAGARFAIQDAGLSVQDYVSVTDSANSTLLALYWENRAQIMRYSCARNVPQCRYDKGYNTNCEATCTSLEGLARRFYSECLTKQTKAVAELASLRPSGANKSATPPLPFECSPVGDASSQTSGGYGGFTGVCSGAGNAYKNLPNLCRQYQNDYYFKAGPSGGGGTGHVNPASWAWIFFFFFIFVIVSIRRRQRMRGYWQRRRAAKYAMAANRAAAGAAAGVMVASTMTAVIPPAPVVYVGGVQPPPVVVTSPVHAAHAAPPVVMAPPVVVAANAQPIGGGGYYPGQPQPAVAAVPVAHATLLN